ncbi:HIT family protein [Dethiosulfatarculus sandiegensis]|uniref:Histidine triad (HIT) protein n=1 Tax=Dethiosulfatarculus sandiegensis TaxID=1429043 RepID=A0A0D2HQZ8_9BACT|nr:HIT family protein [Dethiosulfatarculus sandiegensis]KIX12908.1 histidine triad (HIT) protein [Dethiosulfatarculus sandiegensis]
MSYITKDDCLFCKIVAGEIPCHKVYEDDKTLAFADISPATKGHTLVISKNHAENLLEIASDDLAAVHMTSKKVARAAKDALGCDGVSILQLNGEASGQVVMHYHVHVIPRMNDDGLPLGHASERKPQTEGLEETAKAISQAIK